MKDMYDGKFNSVNLINVLVEMIQMYVIDLRKLSLDKADLVNG